MPEGTEVTFVGGHAVEQSEPLESNLSSDDRETAKEAVRKAMEEAEEAGKQAAKDAKSSKAKDPFKPAGTKRDTETATEQPRNTKKRPETVEEEEEEPIDVAKASVSELLKNREKLANMKREAKDELSQVQRQIEQQRQEYQQALNAFQAERAAFERQRQAWGDLRKDPARAVREMGYDPEQFILDLATDGTPEGQKRRQEQELHRQLKEIQDWKQSQYQAQQQWLAQQKQQALVNQRIQAVDDFLKLSGSKAEGSEDSRWPFVQMVYGQNDRGLIALADVVADEFRKLSGGREADYSEILEFINDDLADRINKEYKKNVKGSQQVELPTVKKVPPKAKGKTLSPEGSGERRALQAKNLEDLDGDERLEAARRAVSVALANSGSDD